VSSGPPKSSLSLFISYAHSDAAVIAGRLADDLRARGFNIWLDLQRINAGASWTRDIEMGIDKSDVVLALLSHGSFHSDICRAEQLRALRKHRRVIPLLLHKDADIPVHLEAGQYLRLDEGGYEQRLKQLLEAIADTSVTAQLPVRYAKRYQTCPPLPPHFVPRPELVERVRQEILQEGTSSISLVAIRGSGGIGKTVLAQAVCHDEVVQDAFPDGVLWVRVGKSPSSEHLCQQIRELAKALADALEAYDTLQGCQNQLRSVLQDKAVLIVLDDVWDPNHVQFFQGDAPRCCLLLTTRSQAVVSGANAREVAAPLMAEHESRELLARKSGLSTEALPPEASKIIQRCAGLPLALAMLGARARKARSEWIRILAALQRGRPERVSLKLSDYPYADLFETTRVSLESLTEEQQSRYLDFAAFPPNTAIPQKVLATLWNVSEEEASDVIESWVEASLANRDGQLVSIHDLQLDYVRSRARDIQEIHRRLVDAYCKENRGDWSRGPDDGYYFSHLAHHMLEAGDTKLLRTLLMSSDWIRAKLDKKGIAALVEDYEFFPPDANVLLIQQALQLSAHVSAKDPSQLAGQLVGRLRSLASSEIHDFLSEIRTTQKTAWLEPLTPSLWRPGAVLVFSWASHVGAVKAVAMPPSGKMAVSASDDHTLKLWDLENGAELATLRGHSAPVNAVAVTPDGKLAVSSSYDKSVKVWDLEETREICALVGHSHLVNLLAITPDGGKVVSASYDRTLKLWDLGAGVPVHTFWGHLGWVNAVCITPDGRHLISASQDQTLKIWDLVTGVLCGTLTGHRGSVEHVVLTPCGREIVSASQDRTIKVWELATGLNTRTLTGHSGRVNRVAITGDGRRIVSVSQDNTLRMWDFNSGSQLQVLTGHSGSVNAVLLLPGDKRAISASDDNSLKIWSLETGTELHNLPAHSGPVHSLVGTLDRRRVVSVDGSGDANLKVWDFESEFEFKKSVGHAQMVNDVAITPDASLAISASNDWTLKVWKGERAQTHALEGHTGAVNSVAVTAEGIRAVSASADSTLRVWDLATGSCMHILAGHSGAVEHVAIAVDGVRAVSAASDGTLKLWDIVHGTELRTVMAHCGWVRRVVITSDGTRAISASYDHAVNIWDLASGVVLHTMEGHESWVNAMAVAGSSRRVVSASYDNTLRVWDLDTGRHVHTLTGHSGSVSAVRLTSDESKVISSSFDHTVRVWDLAAGVLVKTLRGHGRSVNAIAVADDPGLVASASNDNTVRVWTLEGSQIATYSTDSPVVCLDVAGDGQTIVAGDYLGQVHLLRLHLADSVPRQATQHA
jgi:WD40 repeat protein